MINLSYVSVIKPACFALMLGVATHYLYAYQWVNLPPAMGYIFFMTGFILTFRLPDIDLLLNFLGHRSIITHSILWIGLAQMIDKPFLAQGVTLGIMAHLTADLFPESFTANALIKLPGGGSMGKYCSPLWLLGNVLVCQYLLTHFFLTLDSDNNWVFLALSSLLLLGYGFYEERPLCIKIFVFWLISFPLFYLYVKQGLTLNTVLSFIKW